MWLKTCQPQASETCRFERILSGRLCVTSADHIVKSRNFEVVQCRHGGWEIIHNSTTTHFRASVPALSVVSLNVTSYPKLTLSLIFRSVSLQLVACVIREYCVTLVDDRQTAAPAAGLEV